MRHDRNTRLEDCFVRGFSIVELMVVVVIMMVVGAAIFQVMWGALQSTNSEQSKLDMFQEAREFMDQMNRDLHEAGYPNARNLVSGMLTTPVENDPDAAVGIVKLDAGELIFEAFTGDYDTTTHNPIIYSIHYWLDTTVTATNGCPCLKRSALPKINGNPLNSQTAPSYSVEVQHVTNANIFSAYLNGAAGTPITLPIDFVSNPATMSDIDTVKAVLTVESPAIDPRTKQKSYATLVTTVRMNNCSQASSGHSMSCN